MHWEGCSDGHDEHDDDHEEHYDHDDHDQMLLFLQAVPALPVMVFLHGGGYVSGSGSRLLYGPELFMDRQVIS